MALRFIDGFDHYAFADVATKWTTTTGAAQSLNATGGRRGTPSFRLTSAGSSLTYLQKSLDAQQTWTVGFALKVAGLPSASNDILALVDGSNVHATLRLNTTGSLSVTRNGTVLGTSANIISSGSFNYYEMKVKIDDTVGTYDVQVNGANVLTGTGADTRNAGNATADTIRIGNAIVAGNNALFLYDFDDVYICDATGSANTTFLGDVRVDAYLPSGNGNSSQLVNDLGNSTNNSTHVDETAPNGDTDYVQSATVSQKDTYAFTDMSHTPSSIFGVQILMSAKKDDAGTRSIAAVTRSGGTDTDGATQALSTAYVYYREMRETDPNTSAAWTKTNFNAAEFGAKVAA